MTAKLDYRYGGAIYSDQARSTSNPFSVPDWRKPSFYLDQSKLSDAQWRWEFVRRSTSYRENWLSYQNLSESEREFEPERFHWLGLEFKLSYLIDPSIPAVELDEHLLTYDSDFVYWPPLSIDLYDLGKIYDEDAAAFVAGAPAAATTLPKKVPQQRKWTDLEEFLLNAEGLPLFAINPTLPLAPQFTAIKRLVAEHQKEMTDYLYDPPQSQRKHDTKFDGYLRVLDARDQTSPFKATWSVIQKTFENEPGRHGVVVRSIHSQALATQEKMLTLRVVG